MSALLPALKTIAITHPMSAGTSRPGCHTSRGCAPIAVSAPETKPSAGRDQRERAGELDVRARARHRLPHRSPATSASPAPSAEFTKFKRVVVENTRPFERRAEHALGKRRDRRRDHHRGHQADRDQAERRRDRGEHDAARRRPRACPRARPRRRFQAARAAQPVTSHVVLPQALPTSLAIVSLAAVTSAATIARRGRSARAMPSADERGPGRDAGVGDRVAGSAAAAARLRRSRRAPCARIPARVARATRTNDDDEQRPALPAGRRDRSPMPITPPVIAPAVVTVRARHPSERGDER